MQQIFTRPFASGIYLPRYDGFASTILCACCNCFFLLDCGLVSHRTCAATGLPSCLANLDRPLGFEFKSIFGQGLCVQFNPAETPAPAIVRSGLTLFKNSLLCVIRSHCRLYAAAKNWRLGPRTTPTCNFTTFTARHLLQSK